MMSLLKKICTACLCFLCCCRLHAQENRQRFSTTGALTGFGHTISDNTVYRVFFILGEHSKSFRKHPAKKDFAAWYAEPQVNYVRTLRPNDFEFGVNLGIRNYIKANEGLYFYQMLGSGPHFITAQLDRQATGYIFSNNLAAGAFVGVDKKRSLFLNLQFRVRHISNANIKLPNRGVNTIGFLVGLSHIHSS